MGMIVIPKLMMIMILSRNCWAPMTKITQYESSLDSYTTPIDDEENSVDEYLFFKETLQQLESNQHEWYSMLINSLNEKQKKDIENIFVLGNQRKEAKESKKIEQAGGYQFNNQSVPGQFNFANSGFTSPFGK